MKKYIKPIQKIVMMDMSSWNNPDKYNEIGARYNHTRKPDPYLLSRMRDLLQLDSNKLYLDIGCGTGNYTGALIDNGKYNFIGIDPSALMLDQAKSNYPKSIWKQGTAERTGLDDHMVDGIVASLTLHHWEDLTNGFIELHRVINQSGRLVVFTSTAEQMQGYWLNEYFPKMMQDSITQMRTLEELKNAIIKGGFKEIKEEIYVIRPDLEDHFLYCGKNTPKMYLDPMIRSGISSFSHLAHLQEVGDGLIKIQQDILSGRINEVMAQYENNKGDYMFLSARA